MSRFASIFEVTHDWRITVPILMSPAYGGRNIYEGSTHASIERLNYELTKASLKKILQKQADVIVFDPTGDFITAFYEKDGCIINDIGCGLFDREITWPSAFPLNEWNYIKPRSPFYISNYVHYLRELCLWGQAHNIKIIGLKHHIGSRVVKDDGLHTIDDATISETNWWIDALWAEIENAGIDVGIASMSGRLNFTSADAPYGESAYHPVDEYYDVAVNKLCDLMMIGEKLREEMFHDVAVERVRMRACLGRDLVLRTSQRDAAAVQLKEARMEVDRLMEKLRGYEGRITELEDLEARRFEMNQFDAGSQPESTDVGHTMDASAETSLAEQERADQRFADQVSNIVYQIKAVQTWNRKQRRRRIISIVRSSGLVNEAWYNSTNRDVREAAADPVEHFLFFGLREGRHPSPGVKPSSATILRSSFAAIGIA